MDEFISLWVLQMRFKHSNLSKGRQSGNTKLPNAQKSNQKNVITNSKYSLFSQKSALLYP